MDSRKPLLEQLAHYRNSAHITDPERAAVDRIEDFVTREPGCFERATVEGHITGSAWVLDHDRAACLLTHHKKLGLWLQVGGHADGESNVLQVAMKEAQEETGIEGLTPLSTEIFDVDVHEIPARKSDPAHFHFDVRFCLVAPAGAQYVVSDESHDLAWVPRADVGQYNTDASVMRMAQKWCV